jgi:HKD family nuclease
MQIFPQPSHLPFGRVLADEFSRPDCRRVDVAVAWVRASGLQHMEASFTSFLKRGGGLRLVVGIDYDNTSEEGLRGLLEIAQAAGVPARLEAYVRHNEAGPVFHPKLYCFQDDKVARVFVGSNNLTQAGLFQNDELSVLVVGRIGGKLQKDVEAFITSLLDLKSGLVHRLTPAFLDKLVKAGYVRKESLLRSTARARSRSKRTRTALFASASVRPPKVRALAKAVIHTDAIEPSALPLREDWHAVYLRLRLARGTQAQIPIRVVREIRRRMGLTPLDGPIVVKSRADGSSHGINPATARGSINTYKFEAELVKNEPLLRIYPVGSELFFEILDSGDPLGKPVMRLLEDGFKTDPPQTFTTGAKQEIATWYRFE